MSRFPNQRKIYSSTNEQIAWNVHNLLTIEGYGTTIQNESLPDLVVPRIIAPFEVWVRDEEYDNAVIALAVILEGAKPTADSWKCLTCSEQIEGQFTECWNCGKSKEIE